jgi:pimeloyl-ACP methyl ester carboxylesterase
LAAFEPKLHVGIGGQRGEKMTRNPSLLFAALLVLSPGSGVKAGEAMGLPQAVAEAGSHDAGDHSPLIIARQGSFFVSGRTIVVPGTFDPTMPITSDEGEIFNIDQMYARFQIPLHPRRFPLVFVHGAGQTGKCWESTPDGREGYQTMFLRKGFATYVVDFPRRGRAGFPSFNGPLGRLLDEQIIPDRTMAFGAQNSFIRFRLGPSFLEYFPNSQFPKDGLQQWLQQGLPYFTDDADVVSDALVALLDQIGPAILVPHSQSGRFAALSAIKSRNVVAIVDYEGVNHPFPGGEAPEPLRLYDGTIVQPGAPVSLEDFHQLTNIPIQIVEGDNFPKAPVPNLLLDRTRIGSGYRREFVGAVNRHGGNASFLKLPEAGLSGNTHFSFADMNNADIAELMAKFLHDQGLDDRHP